MKYEYRFIAYVDILGFKDLIKRKDIKDVLALLKAFQQVGLRDFNEIVNTGKVGKRASNSPNKRDREVSIFSDLIVISYSNSRKQVGQNVYEIIHDILSLQSSLSFYKILIRGGITYDRLYHKGQICFGDGLIRAYELETKFAIYPRVVIDPRIIKFSAIRSLFDSKLFDLKYFDDGLYGVSYFATFIKTAEIIRSGRFPDQYYYESGDPAIKYNMHIMLLLYKEIITEGYTQSITSERTSNLKLLSKYKWLALEYTIALNTIKGYLKFDNPTLEKLELN